MNTDTFLQWLRLGAAVLCATLLLNAKLSAQQQAAEFTPPFEPGDILVYDVDPGYSPNHNLNKFIVSTGPGALPFLDKASWYNDWRYYPFQTHLQSEELSFRHRFSVDSSGMVLHEGEIHRTPFQLYPAFIPKGTQVIINGEVWNVPRLLDTTVLGVQTRGFEIERRGLRRIITERFGETVMIWSGNVVMALSSAVVRDTAFNRDNVRRDYLPLCVGNRYMHFYKRDGAVYAERLTTVTETAEFDGRIWHHLEGEGPLTGWLRSDSIGVYRYENGQESLLIESDASLGNLIKNSMVIDTGMISPFPNGIDSFFHANSFLFYADYKHSYIWLANFGLYMEDAQYVWSDSYRYTCIWAVICGNEIGVVVGVDRPQPAAEMARINEIYPNPASQLTTVSFSLPSATQAEFILTDMLGWRARHIDAAEYPAGSHRSMLSVDGLRPGLYLLTLRTPSSTVTRRVIVTP